MEIYLIAVDGTIYPVQSITPEKETFLPEFPAGMGYPPANHGVFETVYRDGGMLRRLRYGPRILDLTIVVQGRSPSHLMDELKRLYRAIRPDPVLLKPCRVQVVMDGRTATMDVVFSGETIRQDMAGRKATITLRFVAYYPMWMGGVQSAPLNMDGGSFINSNYSRIYERRQLIDGQPVWVQLTEANGPIVAMKIEKNADGSYKMWVGGDFTSIGGIAANRIAQYDSATNTWSALSGGTNNTVMAIEKIGNYLYVGGAFTSAGGVAASYIARYNLVNGTWENIGDANGVVRAISAYYPVFGTYVVAGGDFTTIGGTTVNYVARGEISGTSVIWSAMGQGAGSVVYAISVKRRPTDVEDTVYIGGNFTYVRQSDGSTVNTAYAAMWRGQWYAMGAGLPGPSTAVAADQDGMPWFGSGSALYSWNGSGWARFTTPAGTIKTIAIEGAIPKWIGGMDRSYPILEFDGSNAWPVGIVSNTNVLTSNVLSADPPIMVVTAPYGTVVFVERATRVVNAGGGYVRPTFRIPAGYFIYHITNETTLRRIIFSTLNTNHPELIIDCTTGTVKDSKGGNHLWRVLPGSDLVSFILAPGENMIRYFGYQAGTPVVEWNLEYYTLAEALRS